MRHGILPRLPVPRLHAVDDGVDVVANAARPDGTEVGVEQPAGAEHPV